MTLKEEEVQRKEMAKILPSIQIGYVDKNAKKYLNNTIEDIIISESSVDEEKNTNEGVDGDEKMDNDVENKLKTISPSIEDKVQDDQNVEEGQNKDSNANKNWTFNFNEDNILASSAGEEANNFLNNLIQRVEEE